MAYSFSKIEFYRTLKVGNTYYTENGVHRCAPGPTPESSELLCTVSEVTVPKNANILSELHIPLPKDSNDTSFDLAFPGLQPSFIRITYLNTYIYGWIDSVSLKSNNAPNLSYILRWHVDYWLTAGNNAQYGSGRLLRGPAAYARPDPSTPRKWVYQSSTMISDGSGIGPYAIVLFTETDTFNHTFLTMAFWPTETSNLKLPYHSNYTLINLSQLYAGMTEEAMDIDPDDIVGAWVSPIPPVTYDANTATGHNGAYGWFEISGGSVLSSFDITLSTAVQTSDEAKYLFIDPNGTTYDTAPWGIEIKTITASLDIASSGAFLNLVTKPSNSNTVRPGEGRMIQIPLMSVSITSNARSSYVLSGQREYDMATAQLQRQQNLQSGIANVGQSALGGAIAGGMSGNPAGTVAGAGLGAIVGLGSAYLNSEIQGYYDRKNQYETDRLMSNQASSVIVSGGGHGWYNLIGSWRMIRLSRDTVSRAELIAEQTELGYLTDTHLADATTIISGKGPLRIEGLQVYGLSPEGNRYISNMFARGVHLD